MKTLGYYLLPVLHCDVNPTPIEMKPRILSTAIDLYDTSASLALSVAREYGIEQGHAKKIAKDVAESVKNWKIHAKSYKISSAEIERMSSAFEHEDFFQAMDF